MKITSIKRQYGNKNKISIFIDGEYSFSIREDDYFKFDLYPNREITQSEINNIINTCKFSDAKLHAINYIGLRVRCQKDIETKLSSLGYEPDVIKLVLDELTEKNFINDELYARKYIMNRIKLSPRSKLMLKYELLSKGINEDIIDYTLKDISFDDETAALDLATKKLAGNDINDINVKRKLIAFLKRRGFADSAIWSAVNKLTGTVE